MNKKHLPLIIVGSILILIIIGTTIYYFNRPNTNNSENTENSNNKLNHENSETLQLPSTGNDMIINTTKGTWLRVVNEFDKNFFTANKNLLIMFASWCPNCQTELAEIEKILQHYKNNSKVNIILIAHEYNDTISDLTKLIENDVNFGLVEVKLDLKRIIRKTIDPEASTIPISYVVDRNGKVLEMYNNSLTLQKAIEMIEK